MIPWGWIGNSLILIGAWQLAHKHRRAFVFYAMGGACWLTEAASIGKVDLMAIETVMLFVTLRNFVKWGRNV